MSKDKFSIELMYFRLRVHYLFYLCRCCQSKRALSFELTSSTFLQLIKYLSHYSFLHEKLINKNKNNSAENIFTRKFGLYIIRKPFPFKSLLSKYLCMAEVFLFLSLNKYFMNTAFSSTTYLWSMKKVKTNKLRWKFYLANWIKKFIKWIKQQNDEPSTSRLNRKCFIFHEMNLMSSRYVSLWGLSQQQEN